MREIHHWHGETRDGVCWEVHHGDALQVLAAFPENRFSCVVTSPPYYWQRDYEVEGQVGQEPTIDGYVEAIASVMDQVRRVLKDDGLLFLNLGDTYYSAKGQPKGSDPKIKARRFGLRAVDASGLGVPRKTAIGVPWRVALEMISRHWVLRCPIIWQRPGSIPEPSAKDRPWRTYETILMFSRSPRYYFCRERLEGSEDIWTISPNSRKPGPYHHAVFPNELIEKCLAVGCRQKGEVLDPFAGSGAVSRVALESGRPATAIDLNEAYCRTIVADLSSLSGPSPCT